MNKLKPYFPNNSYFITFAENLKHYFHLHLNFLIFDQFDCGKCNKLRDYSLNDIFILTKPFVVRYFKFIFPQSFQLLF